MSKSLYHGSNVTFIGVFHYYVSNSLCCHSEFGVPKTTVYRDARDFKRRNSTYDKGTTSMDDVRAAIKDGPVLKANVGREMLLDTVMIAFLLQAEAERGEFLQAASAPMISSLLQGVAKDMANELEMHGTDEEKLYAARLRVAKFTRVTIMRYIGRINETIENPNKKLRYNKLKAQSIARAAALSPYRVSCFFALCGLILEAMDGTSHVITSFIARAK